MSLTAPPGHEAAALRPLRTPAALAVIGIAAVCVMSVADMTFSQFVTADLAPAMTLALAGCYFAVYLLAGLSFIVWLHRASANLHGIGRPMRWGRGWTIGGWFIPIANLFIAPRVVREIDRQTVGDEPTIAVAWVVTWTANLILGRIYAGQEASSLGFALFVTAVEIAAGVFAILLVQRITRGQEHLSRSMTPITA